ncbi:hypothetical protein CQW23_14364 [Capsicum baccatum]|uniref:F-box associated beta-propeller type 1 domain-containing protein n=1 Tax=Capsicum baccatum TaxID=33114 RepID=A0A2G2WIY6_CAPBA|nr:hypothetical protein CQW23_14364 [Capsicum baccatum]
MTEKKQWKLVLPNNQKEEANKESSSSTTKKRANGDLFVLSGCVQLKKKKSVPPILHIPKGENGSTEAMDTHIAGKMDIGQEGIHFPEEILMDILSRPAWIIRCCYDGLVLISTIDTSDQRTHAPHLLLWNPSTRESILLPSRENALSDLVFGLGYDATSDDYKILAADVNGEDSLKEVSVEIFPLKTGSWRKIGKYPTGMHRVSDHLNYGMYSLTFIHGAFHWVGRSAYHTIISFNISNEVYGEIPLLEQMYSMHTYALGHVVYPHNYGVSVLRGMLCYYIMPKYYGWASTFKLWAMKDYGVKESWIQLHEIRDIEGLISVAPQYMFVDDDVLLRFIQSASGTSLYWTSKRGERSFYFFKDQASTFNSNEFVYCSQSFGPETNLKLYKGDDSPFDDASLYRHIVGPL